MQIESIRPFLAVAVALLGAVLILLTRRSPDSRETCSLVSATVMFLIVLHMIPPVLAGNTLNYTLLPLTTDNGLAIAFKVDAMGVTFATVASFLWIMITLYSMGYTRSLEEKAQTRYYLCFAIILSASMGVAFAANLLTLYLFYEVIGFFFYPLVVQKGTEEALKKGNRYVFYIFVLGKLFLIGGLLAYGIAGTLDFSSKGVFPVEADPTLLTLLFILFLVGISKAAMIPFHSWFPAAIIGPLPVLATLAAVDIGAFGILRAAYFIFGIDVLKNLSLGTPLLYLASFTVVAASIIALTKDDLRTRLVYSTIGQISYTLIGAALLAPAALTGGVLQMLTHAIAKVTLFFCAGAIFVASGKTRVSELNGIGKKMPFTMAAFAIGALSIVGVPPFAGFISKWYLFLGAAEAEQYPIIAVLAISSILSASYLLPIVYAAFFKDLPSGETAERCEAPAIMVVPLVITAIGTLTFFFMPSAFVDLAKMVWGN